MCVSYVSISSSSLFSLAAPIAMHIQRMSVRSSWNCAACRHLNRSDCRRYRSPSRPYPIRHFFLALNRKKKELVDCSGQVINADPIRNWRAVYFCIFLTKFGICVINKQKQNDGSLFFYCKTFSFSSALASFCFFFIAQITSGKMVVKVQQGSAI